MALFAVALRLGTRLVIARIDTEATVYLSAMAGGLVGCTVQWLAGALTATPPLSIFLWLALGTLAAWAPHAPRSAVRLRARA